MKKLKLVDGISLPIGPSDSVASAGADEPPPHAASKIKSARMRHDRMSAAFDSGLRDRGLDLLRELEELGVFFCEIRERGEAAGVIVEERDAVADLVEATAADRGISLDAIAFVL